MGFQSVGVFSRRCVRVPGVVACVPRKSIRAGSEELIRVDVWYGLPPVTERAVLWHDKGLVLLFAQQREHMLHQLAKPAVAAVEASRSQRQNERREQREKARETRQSQTLASRTIICTHDGVLMRWQTSTHQHSCEILLYSADSFHFISIKPLGKYLILQLLNCSQAPLYCNFVFCSAKLCFDFFVCVKTAACC